MYRSIFIIALNIHIKYHNNRNVNHIAIIAVSRTEVSNAGDSTRASYLVDLMAQQIKDLIRSNMYNSCELVPYKLRLEKSADLIRVRNFFNKEGNN